MSAKDSVYCVTLNGITSVVSGGDQHILRLLHALHDGQVYILGPKNISLIVGKMKAVSDLLDSSIVLNTDSKNRERSRGFGLFLVYVKRTILASYKIIKQKFDAKNTRRQTVYIAASHFFFDAVPLIFAPKGAPRVVYIHHIVSLSRETGNFWSRYYHHFFEKLSLLVITYFNFRVITVSSAVTQELDSRYKIPESNIYTSSNGINVPNNQSVSRYIPTTFLDKKIILFCGRLHRSKGVFDFVELIKNINDKDSQVVGAMIGAGPEEACIKQKIKELKLEEKLMVTGFISDEEKAEWYSYATVFVSTSYEEGWGIAIGEALSYKIPVVSYMCPNIQSVWEDSVIWAKAGDISEIQQKVEDILSGKIIPNILAIENVLSKFQWHTVLQKEIAYIEQVKVLNQERILFLGSFGQGNMGDDLFLHVAKILFPNTQKTINTANVDLIPDNIKNDFEYIDTQFFRECFRKIRKFLNMQKIVYLGGDVWTLMYENKIKRIHLYKMLLVNICAYICRKKIYYIGVGIGLMDRFSLWLVKITALFAECIIVRDQHSFNLLKSTSRITQVYVAPDLASVCACDTVVAKKTIEKKVVVSLLYHVPEPEKNFETILNAFIDEIHSLIKSGFSITFLPMYINEQDPKDDLWVAKEMLTRLCVIDTVSAQQFSIHEGRNIEDVIDLISTASLVIATRLHAVILSVLAETPVLAISYRTKVDQFMHGVHLEQCALDLGDINNLNAKVSYILESYSSVQAQVRQACDLLKQNGTIYQSAIAEHFNRTK